MVCQTPQEKRNPLITFLQIDTIGKLIQGTGISKPCGGGFGFATGLYSPTGMDLF